VSSCPEMISSQEQLKAFERLKEVFSVPIARIAQKKHDRPALFHRGSAGLPAVLFSANRALTAASVAPIIGKVFLEAVAYKSTLEIPAGRIRDSYEKVRKRDHGEVCHR
jgi:hypothetical protein